MIELAIGAQAPAPVQHPAVHLLGQLQVEWTFGAPPEPLTFSGEVGLSVRREQAVRWLGAFAHGVRVSNIESP
jgi:hypothetical protein